MTPEVEGDTPRRRRRRDDRERREARGLHSQRAGIEERGREGPRDWCRKRGRPRAVAMGVRVMMSVRVMMTGMRFAWRLILVILLVMPIDGGVVIIEVEWRRMGEEHHLPACTVVHHHMQRHHEHGDDQTRAHNTLHRHRLVVWEPPPCPPGSSRCRHTAPRLVPQITAHGLALRLEMGMGRQVAVAMFRDAMMLLA